jgi:hypothetical protein
MATRDAVAKLILVKSDEWRPIFAAAVLRDGYCSVEEAMRDPHLSARLFAHRSGRNADVASLPLPTQNSYGERKARSSARAFAAHQARLLGRRNAPHDRAAGGPIRSSK